MTFTTKTFIAHDGERFSLIFKSGQLDFPLFYPTAFITRAVRLSTTHETQKVYIAAIKRICEWEASRDTDLATSFHRRNFLTIAQIDDLAAQLRSRKTGRKGEVISSSKFNTYIDYAEKYICWLAHDVITDSNNPETRSAIESQSKALLNKKRRKTGSKSASNQRIVATKLTNTCRDQILNLFDNPFEGLQHPQDFGPRIRNIVMIRILYETGMRVGELLSLKLKNLIEAAGGDSAFIEIERNHHDVFDDRVNQPVAKTEGRRVPISEELETQLATYRDSWRADIEAVGFSDDDFFFVVHRGGRRQGRPLPKSTLESALDNLKDKFSKLKSIHPHLLRHDWNYRFSKKADDEGIPFEEERSLREQLMGWAPGSSMSRIYNLRQIQEKSFEIGLKIASDTARETNEKQ